MRNDHEMTRPAAATAISASNHGVAVMDSPRHDQPPPSNMLAVIAAAAADPRVDVAKMKELLAMRREIETAANAIEFNRALLAVQNEIPQIVKDRANDHTKSRYATLEKVSKEINPIVRRHGMTMTFGTADSPLKEHYRIICDLTHVESGYTRHYFVDLQTDTAGAKGTNNKTPVQGAGSTISYGRRYLKIVMFDLTIVGEDNDGNRKTAAPPPPIGLISQGQHDKIVETAESVGCLLPRLVKHLSEYRPKGQPELKRLADLPAERYSQAIDALRGYAANKKEREAKR